MPKIRVEADGHLCEPNDVVCTGIEEKMGIHGSATCSLALGGKGKCRGFLLGEENQGMRSLIYYVCTLFDRMDGSAAPNIKAQCNALAELLTPVIKAYCSDRGFEICVQAIQVFGGYGYIREYPVEQLARDCKIASIYEGTNGIQAMDLLGRKLGLQQGQVFGALLGEIQNIVAQAREMSELGPLAADTEEALNQFKQTAAHIAKTAVSAGFKTAYAHAHPFLEVTGDVTMAWMLLWRAVCAARKLSVHGSGKDAAQRGSFIYAVGAFPNNRRTPRPICFQ